jgi:hypothetical protein
VNYRLLPILTVGRWSKNAGCLSFLFYPSHVDTIKQCKCFWTGAKLFISHIFVAFSKISYLWWALFTLFLFYFRYCISHVSLANFVVTPYKSARVRQGKGSITFPSCVTILNVCRGVCVPRTVLLTLHKLSLSLSLSPHPQCFCSLSMWASAATNQQLSCNNQRKRRCQTSHKCVISGKLNRHSPQLTAVRMKPELP